MEVIRRFNYYKRRPCSDRLSRAFLLFSSFDHQKYLSVERSGLVILQHYLIILQFKAKFVFRFLLCKAKEQ